MEMRQYYRATATSLLVLVASLALIIIPIAGYVIAIAVGPYLAGRMGARQLPPDWHGFFALTVGAGWPLLVCGGLVVALDLLTAGASYVQTKELLLLAGLTAIIWTFFALGVYSTAGFRDDPAWKDLSEKEPAANADFEMTSLASENEVGNDGAEHADVAKRTDGAKRKDDAKRADGAERRKVTEDRAATEPTPAVDPEDESAAEAKPETSDDGKARAGPAREEARSAPGDETAGGKSSEAAPDRQPVADKATNAAVVKRRRGRFFSKGTSAGRRATGEGAKDAAADEAGERVATAGNGAGNDAATADGSAEAHVATGDEDTGDPEPEAQDRNPPPEQQPTPGVSRLAAMARRRRKS